MVLLHTDVASLTIGHTESIIIPEKMCKSMKKLRDLQFPERIAATHPEFTQLFFKSRLAFRIACFRSSTCNGAMNHGLRLNTDGEPLMKMQGKWTPWSTINQSIVFDEMQDSFVSRNNSEEAWNYVSPDGLIPKGRTSFTTLYPIEQLSDEEYQKVVEHAQSFYNEHNPDVEPNVEKRCVFQVVSTYSKDSWRVALPDHWTTKNLHRFPAQHIGLRVINEKKEVYSFGYQLKPEFCREIADVVPFGLMRTNRARFATPDFQDANQFIRKNVTSIPITQEKARCILEYVSQLNANHTQGMCFNYIHQNCSKIGADILRKIDIDIDTRITIITFFRQIAPDLADVPVIGKPLHFLITLVSTVVGVIFSNMKSLCIAITPTIAHQAFQYAVGIVVGAYNVVATVIANIIISILGGTKAVEALPEGSIDTLDNSQGPTQFSSLIRSFRDIFNQQSCTVHYPQTIVDWQKKQTSTQEFLYEGSPNLHVLPRSV